MFSGCLKLQYESAMKSTLCGWNKSPPPLSPSFSVLKIEWLQEGTGLSWPGEQRASCKAVLLACRHCDLGNSPNQHQLYGSWEKWGWIFHRQRDPQESCLLFQGVWTLFCMQGEARGWRWSMLMSSLGTQNTPGTVANKVIKICFMVLCLGYHI